MERGESFPPIDVAVLPDGKLYIVDGFHRHEASLRAGVERVPIRRAHTTEREALALSLDANTRHPLSLNRKDRRNIFDHYVEGGFHLDDLGSVKSLRTIQRELGNIAVPATISRWLKDAGVETSDADDILPWRGGSSGHDYEYDDCEMINDDDREAVHRINESVLSLEGTFATLDTPAARAVALRRLRDLLSRLDPKPDAAPVDPFEI